MSELLQHSDPGDFGWDILDRLPGVPVIVTVDQLFGPAVGVTVTSVLTVSGDPPLVAFTVAATSSRWPALERADHIGLHRPAGHDDGLLEHFAPQGSGTFAGVRAHVGPCSVPLLDDCPSRAVARIQQRIHTGGHVIIVSRLLALRADPRPGREARAA